MRSTFHGIEMMKRSIFTHQTSLQTVGHNISNANTKGYSRQRVNHVSMFPLDFPSLQRTALPGQLGQGVEFDSIKRVRETFLDSQFIKEQRDFGTWSARNDIISKIEAIFNEPSESGIRSNLERFWNSWQELSKDPENLSARAVVRETAVATAEAFNHISRQLTDLTDDINVSLETKTRQINTYLSQLSVLNEQVFRMELLGGNANDLRDKRDLVVDELAKVTNILVDENEKGYTINMGERVLITGHEPPELITTEILREEYSVGNLTGGETFGYLYSLEKYNSFYKDQLDSMIKSLVEGQFEITLPRGAVISETASALIGLDVGPLAEDTKVIVAGINGLHQLGYQLTPELTPGDKLFVPRNSEEPMSASNIMVNPTIIANLSALAASNRTYIDASSVERPVIGNGNNALLISNLRQARIEFPGADPSLTVSGTFDDFFRTLIGTLGVQAQEADRQQKNQKLLSERVDSQRQSISGVSMDEEMADMIKFQQAFNATARQMTTYDEVLDRIINSMGTVGR